MSKIIELQPGISTNDVADLLRQLADQAERGEIVGVSIATLGPHNRYGDAVAVSEHNRLALLGATGVMYHALLTAACDAVDKEMGRQG